MKKEELIELFKSRCLSGNAKKPLEQFAENNEYRICVGSAIGNIIVINSNIVLQKPVTPYETENISFDLTEDEFIALKNVYFDNLIKKVSLVKAFELGCQDIRFKKYLKPSVCDVFFCIELKEGLVIALTKYVNQSTLRFGDITEYISNEKANELIALFDKKECNSKTKHNLFTKLLVDAFGESIFENEPVS